MNSRCLLWYRTQVLLRSNPFSSLACCKQGFISPNTDTRSNITHHYDRKMDMTAQQKIHSRGYRYIRRRPLEIIDNVKYKTMDEYVADSKAQAVEPVFMDDETDISSEMGNNIIKVSKKKPPQSEIQSPLRQSKPEIENIIKIPKKMLPQPESQSPLRQSKPKAQKKAKPKSKATDEEDEEEDENDERVFKGLNIQQYSRAHQKVRKYMEQGKSTHFRQENDFFCVEGWRLLAEGLSIGLKPLVIFFSRSRLFYKLIPTVAQTKEEVTDLLNLFPLYKTPYSVFKLWSSLTTPPGILAVFHISQVLEHSMKRKTENMLPLTVILDEIRDPNNLGSIIRTVVAAGVSKIILTKGCCDLWDTKVLRSTCGAHFHMPCLIQIPWSEIETYLPPSSSVYLANACQKQVEEEEEEALSSSSENVEDLGKVREISFMESEQQSSYAVDEDDAKILVNDSYNDIRHMTLFSNINFPQYHYDNVNYFRGDSEIPDQSSVLIIGGETGLSNCAKKFALEAGGVQVGIPMSNNIDSLNSSVAVGILVYEAKKQHRELLKQANKTTVT